MSTIANKATFYAAGAALWLCALRYKIMQSWKAQIALVALIISGAGLITGVVIGGLMHEPQLYGPCAVGLVGVFGIFAKKLPTWLTVGVVTMGAAAVFGLTGCGPVAGYDPNCALDVINDCAKQVQERCKTPPSDAGTDSEVIE